MNLNFIKNKFIITILFAAILQLLTFILSQWLIKVDQDIESKNYRIISSQMKFKDLVSHAYDIIPDLISLNGVHRMNSYIYLPFYKENQYEDSFQPIIENLKFYLTYIKEDFFIEEMTDFNEQLSNLEKDYDNIKDKRASEKINFLESILFDIKSHLTTIIEVVRKKNYQLILQQNNLKNKRLLINVSLVITQILNLLFISFFLFLILSNTKETK
jgi:hypothetical protein